MSAPYSHRVQERGVGLRRHAGDGPGATDLGRRPPPCTAPQTCTMTARQGHSPAGPRRPQQPPSAPTNGGGGLPGESDRPQCRYTAFLSSRGGACGARARIQGRLSLSRGVSGRAALSLGGLSGSERAYPERRLPSGRWLLGAGTDVASQAAQSAHRPAACEIAHWAMVDRKQVCGMQHWSGDTRLLSCCGGSGGQCLAKSAQVRRRRRRHIQSLLRVLSCRTTPAATTSGRRESRKSTASSGQRCNTFLPPALTFRDAAHVREVVRLVYFELAGCVCGAPHRARCDTHEWEHRVGWCWSGLGEHITVFHRDHPI